MLPILLQFSFVKIYTFGVFLVLALFWGSFFLWKNIRLTAYKEDTVFDGLFFAMAGGALIGRIAYVTFHFQDFGFNLLKFILFNGYPGFSFWGFIVGFFLTLSLFAQSQRIRFVELVDYFVPPFFLAMAIGKVGAFFSGAEFGAATSFPLAITYANYDGMRHLTPLYEGVLLFLGVFLSFRMLFAVRREHLSRGFLFLFFLWFYSAVYVAFDPLRGERTMINNYSAYGVLSLVVLLTLTVYFIYYFRAAIFAATIGNFTKKTHGKSPDSGIHTTAKGTPHQRKG
jgi:phosphatidylglycerol:prolipoprotein diacylglycerol transferase